MTERPRGFYTFKSPEELLEYHDSLPESQKAAIEQAWEEYFDLSDEARKLGIEAERRFHEVLNPVLALNAFAFIEIFKRHPGLGLAAHAAGDILFAKAAIDFARKSTPPKLGAIRKGIEALQTSGIEIRGIRDWLNLLRLSHSLKFK